MNMKGVSTGGTEKRTSPFGNALIKIGLDPCKGWMCCVQPVVQSRYIAETPQESSASDSARAKAPCYGTVGPNALPCCGPLPHGWPHYSSPRGLSAPSAP